MIGAPLPVIELQSEAPAIREDVSVPWIGRALDLVGLGLLGYLQVRLLWDVDRSFDVLLGGVALAGVLGALVTRQMRRTPIDGPLGVFVGLTLASSAWNWRRYETLLGGERIADWQPAMHLVLLAMYFYGAVWLLRTSRRLAALVAQFVGSVSLIGLLAFVDHLSHGLGHRVLDFQHIPQWTGYSELGLIVALAFPFPIAVAMLSRSKPVVLCALLIAAGLSIWEVSLFSRAGTVALAAGYVLLAGVEWVKLRRGRLIAGAIAVVVAAAAVLFRKADPSSMFDVGRVAAELPTRVAIWRAAAAMLRDHPWLGVGLGHYSEALRLGGYAVVDRAEFWHRAHAHNMLLNVANESGLPAVLAFVWLWWTMFRTGFAGPLSRTVQGAVKLGAAAALAIFFFRGATDHFLSGLYSSERIGMLLFTMCAALIAASRLDGRTRTEPS